MTGNAGQKTKTQIKRGRGRPPKPNVEGQKLNLTKPNVLAKRGRGRPPKSNVEGQSLQPIKPKVLAKKGRGRPPGSKNRFHVSATSAAQWKLTRKLDQDKGARRVEPPKVVRVRGGIQTPVVVLTRLADTDTPKRGRPRGQPRVVVTHKGERGRGRPPKKSIAPTPADQAATPGTSHGVTTNNSPKAKKRKRATGGLKRIIEREEKEEAAVVANFHKQKRLHLTPLLLDLLIQKEMAELFQNPLRGG